MGAVGANHISTRSALRMKASSSLKNPVSEANSEMAGGLKIPLPNAVMRPYGYPAPAPPPEAAGAMPGQGPSLSVIAMPPGGRGGRAAVRPHRGVWGGYF